MSTDFNAGVTDLKTNEAKLLDQRGRVARFCYEEQALEGNSDTDVFGVNAYNYNNTQNVPMGTSAVLQMSESVLSKGLRSQGSSFTRMGVNHFWGRVSYNVNKLAKHMSDLLSYFKDFLRESGNAWSPTAIYLTGDTVYCMVTLGGAPYKRIFLCLQSNTDVSPVDENGNAINPSYWQEIGGNFASDINVRGNGRFQNDVQVEKNLNVRGDLIVEGSTIITDEQTVSTEADYVVLRKNNPSALGSAEKAGMVIHNYDSNKNAFIGVDKDGIFRVSDNASENTTVYNNVSRFGSDYFESLTQTPATVVSGAVTAEDVDELENCVLNDSSYYYNLNAQWFLVSLSSNALYFDSTSPVTDASLIAVLEASVKKTLFYFRSLSVLVVSDTQNQPLMTRDEVSNLPAGTVLCWDAVGNKAEAVPSPTEAGQILTATGVNSKVQFSEQIVSVQALPVSPDIQTRLYKYNSRFYVGDSTNQTLTELALSTDVPVTPSPIGTIVAFYGSTSPAGWFICDGTDTTGTPDELSTHYPELYVQLGNSNVLPDLREASLVGIGQRSSGVTTHDTYTLGQFKDDQVGVHTHCYWDAWGNDTNGLLGYSAGAQVDVRRAFSSSPVQYTAWRWGFDHGYVYEALNGVDSRTTWDTNISAEWDFMKNSYNNTQCGLSTGGNAGGVNWYRGAVGGTGYGKYTSGGYKGGMTASNNWGAEIQYGFGFNGNHNHYNDHRHIMPYVGSNTDGGNPDGRSRASGERNGNVTRGKRVGVNFIIKARN